MSDDATPTRPTSTTREAEAADAQVHAGPDEMPSPEDEKAAERAPAESPEVSENYREAIERGFARAAGKEDDALGPRCLAKKGVRGGALPRGRTFQGSVGHRPKSRGARGEQAVNAGNRSRSEPHVGAVRH